MAPVLAVVLVVEYVVLRLLFRARPRRAGEPRPDARRRRRCPRSRWSWSRLMLVGFAALSPFGVEPFWVSGAAAVVLVGVGARADGLLDRPRAVHAAHPSFAVFVLAPRRRGGRAAERASSATRWPTCCPDSHVVRRPAGDRRGRDRAGQPAHQPLGHPAARAAAGARSGTPAVLAALLGLNIGSGLTYTGSLANLLWRRSLVRHGGPPGMRDFHRVSLVATPARPARGGHVTLCADLTLNRICGRSGVDPTAYAA